MREFEIFNLKREIEKIRTQIRILQKIWLFNSFFFQYIFFLRNNQEKKNKFWEVDFMKSSKQKKQFEKTIYKSKF